MIPGGECELSKADDQMNPNGQSLMSFRQGFDLPRELYGEGCGLKSHMALPGIEELPDQLSGVIWLY